MPQAAAKKSTGCDHGLQQPHRSVQPHTLHVSESLHGLKNPLSLCRSWESRCYRPGLCTAATREDAGLPLRTHAPRRDRCFARFNASSRLRLLPACSQNFTPLPLLPPQKKIKKKQKFRIVAA